MKQLTISILVILSLYSSSQPMSGTYTIGSGGYFVSINQAIDSLQAKGIGGPVVLNVLPGIYNESLKFDSINGTNAFNTITLQAANGDSSSVVITHTASTYSNTIISTNISNIL
jgi:pectin methylesterase-like acyl-CoA thioesterase